MKSAANSADTGKKLTALQIRALQRKSKPTTPATTSSSSPIIPETSRQSATSDILDPFSTVASAQTNTQSELANVGSSSGALEASSQTVPVSP